MIALSYSALISSLRNLRTRRSTADRRYNIARASFHYRDGHLYCEDVDLNARCQGIRHADLCLQRGNNSRSLHATRRRARAAGSPHLLCGKSELESRDPELARTCGRRFRHRFRRRVVSCARGRRRSGQCTFAGVGKSRDEIEYALEQGVYSFNVESEAELERIDRIARAKKMRAPIALRVNPDVDPHTHQYISTGSHENKFGIALDQVRAVYERAAKMSNIEIVGVQMHIGSQITEAKPFASAIEKVAPLVRELKSKYAIKFFSIGGGMGIIYRRALESGSGKWWRDHGRRMRGSAFSVRDYAEAIVPPLRDLGIRILVEPGRFLVGNAGVLLTRVRYIKQTGSKKFAIVDAGMNDLIRPALYQSYHEIVPVMSRHPPLSGGGREAPGSMRTSKQDWKRSTLSDRCVSRAIFLRSTGRCRNCMKAICSQS